MHHGHQWSSSVRKTKADPGTVDVVEHERDAVDHRPCQERRQDVARGQSSGGRRSVRPHVPVRRHVLAVRSEDRPGTGH